MNILEKYNKIRKLHTFSLVLVVTSFFGATFTGVIIWLVPLGVSLLSSAMCKSDTEYIERTIKKNRGTAEEEYF